MLAINAEKLLVSLTFSWNSDIQSRGGVHEVTETRKIRKIRSLLLKVYVLFPDL